MIHRLAVLAFALVAVTARAETARVVVIGTGAAATPGEEELVWAARDEVERVDALASVDVVGALAEQGTDLELGADALAEGRAAYDELALDQAEAPLRGALSRFVSAGPAAREEAAATAVLLAQVLVAQRRPREAPGVFALLLRLDAGASLSSGEVPPSVARAFDEARKALASGGVGDLRVDTAPVSASLRLDGRRVGVTPGFLQGLPAGAHVLTVEADGYEREVRVVDVPPGKGVAVQVRLRPALKAPLLDEIRQRLPAEAGRDDAGGALRDLRSLVFAEQAILVVVRDGQATGHLYDLAAARRVRTVRIAAEPAREAGVRLVQALYAGLNPDAPGLVAPEVEEQPVAETPLHRRWWFWPAVATGVAVAVAVPVALLAGDDGGGLKRRDGAGAVILRF